MRNHEQLRHSSTLPTRGESMAWHKEWVRVGDNELPLVRQVEVAKHAPSLDAYQSVWACSLCVDFNAHGDVMENHLADV